MNSWTLLLLAGLLEVCWAVGLKYTDGFTKLVPSLLVGAALAGYWP
jgi:quaternary ammonium compound-resistance protein SugE